jgi:glycosyltransferase involved in cell wall biosynthesis
MTAGEHEQRVAVWRYRWLPSGETFIRHHVEALHRWRPVPFGVEREESPLASPDDVVLYGRDEAFRRRVLRLTGWAPRVRRFLLDGAFDLVHAHFGLDAVVIAPICRRLGMPLVVTLHGEDVTAQVHRRGLYGASYRHRLRRTLAGARAVLAVSDEIARCVRELGCDDVRVHVLGVPLPQRPAPETRPAWDVLFAGRLVEKKGVFDLLEALAHLREQGLPVRTAVAGDGPLAGDIKDFASERGVPVDFLGFRRPDEVLEMMSRSAILAVPSRQAENGDCEGLPTVVMEAASVGRPVVGYRHSGIAQAVDHGVTGLLAPEGDTGALGDHLAALLRDPDRRARMGAAARRKAEAEFDIDAQTAELEDLYDDVVRKEHR